jgi:hypothetical protein
MIEIHDPIDPKCEYGLILYDYQRTASDIERIYNDYYFGLASIDILYKLPELISRHKKEQDEFFEGKDIESLRQKYAETCNNVGPFIIDTFLYRNN